MIKGGKMNPKSLENLIEFKKGDSTDKVENGRLGGIKSGESKRKAKTIKQILEAWAESKPSKLWIEQLTKLGIVVDENKTALEALVDYTQMKALDSKASLPDLLKLMETVAKYTGQEPAQKIDIVNGLESNIDRIKEMENHFDDK